MNHTTSRPARRRTLASIAALAAAIVLGACGGDDSSSATTATSPPGTTAAGSGGDAATGDTATGGDTASTTATGDGAAPATGTVTLWAPDGDASVLDATLAPFKAANPDLDVEITLIPSDQYNTKLQTAIASGTTPDMAQLYTETEAQFLDDRVFAPVPDGLVDPSTFFAASWDAGLIGDTAYSVPWYTYTYTLQYRKDLAEQAGAEAPTTVDELVPFFEALQSAGAEKGLAANVGWDIFNAQDATIFTWQNGGDVMNADQTAWTFADNPAFLDALELVQSIFTSGAASLDGPTFLDTLPYFVDAKVASMISGPWNVVALDTVADQPGWVDDHLATVPLPAGSAGSAGPIGGASWAVFDASDHQDAAWKLIQFLAQTDTQVAQYQAFGSMPSVSAAWSDPSIADQPLLDAFFEQLQSARSYPQVTTWAEVATELGKTMEALARGSMTPEQVADEIQSFADGVGTG